jgi:hypothetical protein
MIAIRNIKFSTKGLLAVATVGGALLQNDAVQNYIVALGKSHPSLSALGAALLLIGALLHPPVKE